MEVPTEPAYDPGTPYFECGGDLAAGTGADTKRNGCVNPDCPTDCGAHCCPDCAFCNCSPECCADADAPANDGTNPDS